MAIYTILSCFLADPVAAYQGMEGIHCLMEHEGELPPLQTVMKE